MRATANYTTDADDEDGAQPQTELCVTGESAKSDLIKKINLEDHIR